MGIFNNTQWSQMKITSDDNLMDDKYDIWIVPFFFSYPMNLSSKVRGELEPATQKSRGNDG